jgi:hypothetical protein
LDHRLHGAIVRQVRQAARRVPGQDRVDVDADVAGARIAPILEGVELYGEELAGAICRPWSLWGRGAPDPEGVRRHGRRVAGEEEGNAGSAIILLLLMPSSLSLATIYREGEARAEAHRGLAVVELSGHLQITFPPWGPRACICVMQ